MGFETEDFEPPATVKTDHEVVPMGFETFFRSEQNTFRFLIMKLSLWDLKPKFIKLIFCDVFHHEVVPMGFETKKITGKGKNKEHHEVVPMGFETQNKNL